MSHSTTRILTSSLIMAGFVATVPTQVAAAEWGNLKGRFVFDGIAPDAVRLNVALPPQCANHNVMDERLIVDKKSLGIKNVLIYVSSEKVNIHPSYEKTAKDTIVMDNKRCRFDPHVVVVRISQTLKFHNSDPLDHNFNMAPFGDAPVNPLLGQNGSVKHNFSKAQRVPVPVSCNVHGWMRGFVVVRNDPYAALSDDQGSFELKNLPVGELEFTVWQEKSGWLAAGKDWSDKGTFKRKIEAGDNELGLIKVSPLLFEKNQRNQKPEVADSSRALPRTARAAGDLEIVEGL